MNEIRFPGVTDGLATLTVATSKSHSHTTNLEQVHPLQGKRPSTNRHAARNRLRPYRRRDVRRPSGDGPREEPNVVFILVCSVGYGDLLAGS